MRGVIVIAGLVWWSALANHQLVAMPNAFALAADTGEWRGDTICDHHDLHCSSTSTVRRSTQNP